jgi:hypothetical protein
MKYMISINSLLVVLGLSFTTLHKANIQILSPKANASFKVGQTLTIEATVSCERPLQSARVTIADAATGKVIFSDEQNVAGKRSATVKSTWKLTLKDPSVLTLRIEVDDDDGHPTDKVIQFNANF